MSAIGPKQTWAIALHMSAFGGKADMTFCGCLLFRSLLGVKRTWAGAVHMSAFYPKRTWAGHQHKPKCLLFKRDKRRGLPQKAAPYMFQGVTGVANWIRWQASQTCPRATDTINLSQFARKIFSAPSSSRGS